MTHQLHAVSRTACFAPGAAGALGGWAYLGQPAHLAGLGVMTVAGLIAWPVLVMSAVLLRTSALAGVLVPRRVRGAYRRHLVARGVPRQDQRSSYISRRLRRVTYAADRYRCVGCGVPMRRGLQIDHIHPWIAGGLTVLWNCMSLCPECNGIKSNYNRERDGYEHYAGHRYWMPEARRILHREKWHRFSVLRWWRAAWALGG